MYGLIILGGNVAQQHTDFLISMFLGFLGFLGVLYFAFCILESGFWSLDSGVKRLYSESFFFFGCVLSFSSSADESEW